MNKLRSLNPEQIASIVRTILQVVGAILGTAGYMTDAEWALISGPLLTLVTTIWGFVARSDENLIKSAAAVPAVEKVVAPGTAVAGDYAVPKVTAS